MRFAFVTDELPRPGSAGHLAFNHAVISWLRGLGAEVTVVLVRPRLRLPVERYGEAPVAGPGLRFWGGHVFAARPIDAARIVSRYFLGRLPVWLSGAIRRRGRAAKYGLVDTVLGAFITPAQAAWCATRIAGLNPDAVLVDTIFRSAILQDPRLHGLNSVIVAHDVFHLRHRALGLAGYQVHPAVLSRELEARMLNYGHAIAAIQPDEAALIRKMCPDRLVFAAPMPALPCPRPAGTRRGLDHLVFVGSDSMPNIDGLRWFLSDIWPRLKTWRDTVTLELIGDCGRAFGRLPEGVSRAGRVRDMAPALHRASLAISPLRVGSGLKIKLLDYARHGLITVATPESLQGFAEDDSAPFIAAADAVSFTVAIAEQLRRARLNADEQRALGYVIRHYGVERSFSGLAGALGIGDNGQSFVVRGGQRIGQPDH
jgi:hypothetical protein